MRVLVLILMLAIFVAPCSAGVIFEDNFDSHVDWQPRPVTNDAAGESSCDYTSSVNCTGVPGDWSYSRATGLWWGPTYQDTIRVTNQADRGGSGKSFIVYNESNSGASGDGWGADGQLTKLFSQDYPELYTRAWIRTQASWQSVAGMQIKMFRVGHYDKTGSIYKYAGDGFTAPLEIFDFFYNNYGTRWLASHRGDPQDTRYNLGSDQGILVGSDGSVLPTAAGMLADTQWHRLDTHVKMNTYDSGSSTWNSDGVYELWYDGTLKISRSDMKWKDTGSDASIGWNVVTLGGNALNNYADPSAYGEQWYAIDDVVVSTTAIPADYVIGGSAAPPAPSTPRFFGRYIYGTLR